MSVGGGGGGGTKIIFCQSTERGHHHFNYLWRGMPDLPGENWNASNSSNAFWMKNYYIDYIDGYLH